MSMPPLELSVVIPGYIMGYSNYCFVCWTLAQKTPESEFEPQLWVQVSEMSPLLPLQSCLD